MHSHPRSAWQHRFHHKVYTETSCNKWKRELKVQLLQDWECLWLQKVDLSRCCKDWSLKFRWKLSWCSRCSFCNALHISSQLLYSKNRWWSLWEEGRGSAFWWKRRIGRFLTVLWNQFHRFRLFLGRVESHCSIIRFFECWSFVYSMDRAYPLVPFY